MQRQTATKNKPERINSSSLSRGFLQRKCACGNQSAGGGECGECGKNKQFLQRRATHVSEPGDRYEQEADRIADLVMRMPESTAKHQVESEKEGVFQRKAIANSITPLQSSSAGQDRVSEVPPIVDEVLRSPGQHLDTETRAFMEPRFGQDFSQVRVHTDAKAANSAKKVNALAYTVGQDIVFAAGQYVPKTLMRQKLLAHELTHVLQQRPANSGVLQRQSASVCGCTELPTYVGFSYDVGYICLAKKCAPAVRDNGSHVCLDEGNSIKLLKITQAKTKDGSQERWLHVEILDGRLKGEELTIRDRFVDFCSNPKEEQEPKQDKPEEKCTLPIRILDDDDCGSGDDFNFFDFPKVPPDKAKLLNRFQKKLDSELIETMKLELGGLAGEPGKQVVDQFTTGKGHSLLSGEDTILGKQAKTSPSFVKVQQEVKRRLLEQVKSMINNNTVDCCKLKIAPKTIPRVDFSRSSGDTLDLNAVFGGTQGFMVDLINCSFDATKKTVAMELQYIICDDFGVDFTDVTDQGLKGFSNGLKAFWVLQHERKGNQPFINYIRFSITFNGSL